MGTKSMSQLDRNELPLNDFREVGRVLSNWGRWGDDDQRGTLNLITPEVVRAAALEVVTGEVLSLAVPFDQDGPQDGRVRSNPLRFMKETGHRPQGYPGAFRYADDYVVMALQAASQWDALAHVHYDGLLYNGFSADDVGLDGAEKCAVTNLLPSVTSRAVLVDVARHRGVPWLERGTPIEPSDLDEVLAAQRSEVREGDVIVVRTGWWARFLSDRDKTAYKSGEPGLTLACAVWLHDHGVAAVGSDNFAVEVLPGQVDGEYLPFHMVALRDLGMPLAEILDLEGWSAACASDGRYAALFCAAPLPFTKGVGSPVNPVVVR